MADARTTLSEAKYISLVTQKRNGDHVATPVWIVTMPDGWFGFTTELNSGKVKRIRNFPDVTVQVSNARGVVKEGSEPIAVRATVLTGDEVPVVRAAIVEKYGFFGKLIAGMQAIVQRFKRADPVVRCAIRLDLP
jgi:PPOX class probable F420-dependent enzyme